MEKKIIAKKSLLYLIGNFSSKILSSLLIPLYAFKVSSSDLGTFDNAQSWMNVVIPIVFIAIWESILKFVLSEEDDSMMRKIISSSLVFILSTSLFFSVMAVIYNLTFRRIENIYFIVPMMLFGGLAQIWQYYARALKKNFVYVISGVVSTTVNVVFIILFLCIFNLGAKGLFIAYTISQLSVILTVEITVHILHFLSLEDFDIKILRKLLLFSSPLVLNLISGWLISGFGRIVITQFIGTFANGLYSFANKFAILISTLGSVISMSIIEESILSAKNEEFDKRFTQVMETVFNIFQSLIILAIPAIAIFYYIIRVTEYYSSLSFTPLLLIYAVLMTMSTNVGAIFQVVSKTKYQFITTALGAVVTVVLSLCFINILGVLSVIIGQVVGAVMMLISRYIFANRYVNLRIHWRPIIMKLLVFIVISLICINSSLVMSCLILVIATIYVAIINKQYIIFLIQFLRERANKTK
jgi:O-antigen/teichoic acid export membrane protein